MTAAPAPTKPALPPDLLGECENDPALYATEVLGVTPWDRQRDALATLAEIAAGKCAASELAIRSGNGVGKSLILACAASWWFDIVRGSCFITSPTQRQNKSLFGYVRGLRIASPFELPGELFGTEIRGSDQWWMRLVTARTAEAFQGMHAFAPNDANRPRMLALVEEASGVAQMMWPAIRGCATGDHDVLVAIGNPNTPTGEFADYWRLSSSDSKRITISALDSPNVKSGREVVPGLVSKRFVDGLRRRYGADSDVYRVRVLGLPPKNDAAAIVPFSVWETAKTRGALAEERAGTADAPAIPPIKGRLRAGLDPGGKVDTASFVIRDDVRIRDAKRWSGELAISLRTAQEWLRQNPEGVLATDAGGVGAMIAEVLVEEFGNRVVAVQFGGVPVGEDEDDYLQATASSERVHRFKDRRTEIWWGAREWLESTGEVGSELDPESLADLETELLAPRLQHSPKGQLWAEPKDVTRKRLGRSPDLGDALALACAADLCEEVATAGAATVGAAAGRPWCKPTARSPRGVDAFAGTVTVGGYAMTADNWRRHG